MTRDRKHPPSSPGDLLDELSSIQSLLGDGARDVPRPGGKDGDPDIPLLPPDDDAPPDGDAHNQIPLLGGSPAPVPGHDSLRRALAERDNPFLPHRPATPEKAAVPPSRAIEELIARRAETQRSATPATAPATGAPPLSEQDLRAVVDEILSEWMPRLERELRQRLIDLLARRPDRS